MYDSRVFRQLDAEQANGSSQGAHLEVSFPADIDGCAGGDLT